MRLIIFVYASHVCAINFSTKRLTSGIDSVSCIKLNSVRLDGSWTYACLVHIISIEFMDRLANPIETIPFDASIILKEELV